MRVYNYPWSGRLGRCSEVCLYCGDGGSAWSLSSAPDRCLKCSSDKQPIPELMARMEATAEESVRSWCLEHGLDYEATVEALRVQYGGDPDQDFVVIRDDLEVAALVAALSPDQTMAAKYRGYTPIDLLNFYRFGVILGQEKGVSPFEGPCKDPDPGVSVTGPCSIPKRPC